jgi:hypothetical protein
VKSAFEMETSRTTILGQTSIEKGGLVIYSDVYTFRGRHLLREEEQQQPIGWRKIMTCCRCNSLLTWFNSLAY